MASSIMKQMIIGIQLLTHLGCQCICAQTSTPINTDRPDQSDGTYTMPKNSFQLESGFIFGKEVETYFLHNTMVRYGITSSTEIRLLFDYGSIGEQTGILAPGISIKQYLFPQKKWIPEMTAVGYIRLPYLATDYFKTDHPAATLLLAFQNTVSGKFSVGYNLGATLDGDHAYTTWIVTTSLVYTPSKYLSFFAEYFSSFGFVLKPANNIDIGVLWLVKDNFQVDLALGSTIAQEAKNRFVTTGFSYRF